MVGPEREEHLDPRHGHSRSPVSGRDTVSAAYGHREGTLLTVLKFGITFLSPPLSSPLMSGRERGSGLSIPELSPTTYHSPPPSSGLNLRGREFQVRWGPTTVGQG